MLSIPSRGVSGRLAVEGQGGGGVKMKLTEDHSHPAEECARSVQSSGRESGPTLVPEVPVKESQLLVI